MKKLAIPFLATALAVISSPAWAQKATLAEVFNGDMLGTNLRYFESIAGVARESFGDQHTYRVQGCEVTVTGEDAVSALRLELSPTCKADIASFIGDFAPPANQTLTFGNFHVAAGDLSYYSDCLTLCGNAADPSVYAHWQGPRAVGFTDVLLEVVLVDGTALDAKDVWRQSMEQAKGEDWVMETKFNCERTFDAQAQQAFNNVAVTAITIGSELKTPECY